MALSASLYRAWLKRLRTGKKAKTRLVDTETGGMCCLGHLAVAAGYKPTTSGTIEGCIGILSPELCKKINLPDAALGHLVNINDSTEGFGPVIQRIKKLRKERRL